MGISQLITKKHCLPTPTRAWTGRTEAGKNRSPKGWSLSSPGALAWMPLPCFAVPLMDCKKWLSSQADQQLGHTSPVPTGPHPSKQIPTQRPCGDKGSRRRKNNHRLPFIKQEHQEGICETVSEAEGRVCPSLLYCPCNSVVFKTFLKYKAQSKENWDLERSNVFSENSVP